MLDTTFNKLGGAIFATVALFSAGLLVPSAALATPITIANHDFEMPTLALGAFTVKSDADPIPGWTISGSSTSPSGVGVSHGTTIVGTNGPQTAFVVSSIEISQALADTLAVDTLYTLEVDIYNRGDAGLSDFLGYVFQLFADGNLLAEDNSSVIPAVGTWGTSTLIFDSTGSPFVGDALEIKLAPILDPQRSVIDIDNVRLNGEVIDGPGPGPSVPEPTTLLLLGLGLAGLGFARKRLH